MNKDPYEDMINHLMEGPDSEYIPRIQNLLSNWLEPKLAYNLAREITIYILSDIHTKFFTLEAVELSKEDLERYIEDKK